VQFLAIIWSELRRQHPPEGSRQSRQHRWGLVWHPCPRGCRDGGGSTECDQTWLQTWSLAIVAPRDLGETVIRCGS